MMELAQRHRRLSRTFMALSATLFVAGPAAAQTLSGAAEDPWREPVLPRYFGGLCGGGEGPSWAGRSPRIRMFRMPTAFLTDPLGLEDNDPLPEGAPPTPPGKDDGPVQVSVGNDNPFFDFRMPGESGGVGYYKVHTQLQLVGGSRTWLTVGMQAVTPAGLEADGLADGPTVLNPNLSWFQEVGGGAAIQGFVGKSMRAAAHWTDQPALHGLQYGLALQSPLVLPDGTPTKKVHLFVEALGRYRPNTDSGQASAVNWDLVPGVHWRMSESWWMSGGVLLPLGEVRQEGRFQITCSWQF
jgi:hypothetical protein